MDLQYGYNHYDREAGDFPSLPVLNMYVEQNPQEETPVLIARPALEPQTPTYGSGSSIEALIQQDGVLSSKLFTLLSDNKFYHVPATTPVLIGTLDGILPTTWGGYSNNLFVTRGGSLWRYDGATLTTVATPGGFSPWAICVGSSRLVVIKSGTGQLYWTQPLATTIDALDFATAENAPDNLLDLLFIGDTLYLFGTETVEIWPISSDPDAPFAPLVGRTYQVGIRDLGCATKFAGSFAWITDNNKICHGSPDKVISSPTIEDKLSNSNSAVRLWTFWIDSTEFLAMSFANGETYVFSSASSVWSQFADDATTWDANCYAAGRFGSRTTGKHAIWYDGPNRTEAYSKIFRAGLPLTTGSQRVDNITIRLNAGSTPYYFGQTITYGSKSMAAPASYYDPQIEMRTSMDGGRNWTAWIRRPLGKKEEYRRNPQWRALGFFGYPGFLAEFKVTAPIPFRVSGVKANESYGKR